MIESTRMRMSAIFPWQESYCPVWQALVWSILLIWTGEMSKNWLQGYSTCIEYLRQESQQKCSTACQSSQLQVGNDGRRKLESDLRELNGRWQLEIFTVFTKFLSAVFKTIFSTPSVWVSPLVPTLGATKNPNFLFRGFSWISQSFLALDISNFYSC